MDAAALIEEGLAHHRAGRLAQAGEVYRSVLAAEPENPDALHLLGVAAHQAGDNDDALGFILRALDVKPEAAAYHQNLGSVYLALGRADDAVAAYRRALERTPDAAPLHYNLGNAIRETGDIAAAIGHYRRALAIHPDYAEAHGNLGTALDAEDRLEEAVAAFRRALEIAPDAAETHYNLGHSLQKLNRAEDAIACYDKALGLDAELAQAHHNRGVVLQSLGRYEEAVAAGKRAIAIRPDLAETYHNIAHSKTYTADDPDIAAMEALLAGTLLEEDKKLHVHFALGKALQDIGEYDRAFECFATGNRLKRRIVDYRTADQEKAVERIAMVFDEALFERLAGVGHASDAPVFIVGMPRSGSSLIEQILASHPDVHGAGESMALGRIVHELEGGYPEGVPAIDDWRGLGERYLEDLLKDAPAARRVTDKMPRNVERIGLIHLMLPHARIIHCLRDPLDTCVSCYTLWFKQSQDFTYDLSDLGAYYRLYERLVDHWRRVLPGKLLDVRYEDVVADLEGSTRRLLDFCGLEWNDACLDFHNSDRIVRTASAAQVRRPLFAGSVGRWRRYERHLGPLMGALSAGQDIEPEDQQGGEQ